MDSPEGTRTYQNPVYPHYFADPFVWKHDGKYFAVGTGPVGMRASAGEEAMTSYPGAGRSVAFPLLFSRDFCDWKLLGGALEVPRFAEGAIFWAPEVAHEGRDFYLYYSCSLKGLKHQLRVAHSRGPGGPYVDAGFLMPNYEACPFAIDPHPFQDEDGQWYLFYARDFPDTEGGARAGTALVMDRLVGMTRLAGEERVVLRASHDWQRFRADRTLYGRVFDWHTLEGPCVRRRDGLYYCFYSGGCYENESYGVDYAVAEHVTGPYRSAGAERGPRVLKTMPGRVLGPGHQSVVLGPDDQTEYLAYHAWDPERQARRMHLDRLAWTAEGPRCAGPTLTPQEVPAVWSEGGDTAFWFPPR